MLFINKSTGAIVWAENFEQASLIFGTDIGNVFNFGTLLIPFVVAVFCVLGAILARKMPKDYSADLVVDEFRKLNPELAIENVTEEQFTEKEEKSEILFVQIGLSILSGFIFGFV